MWHYGSMDDLKRKVYLVLLPIMTISALIDWRLQLFGASDPVGRIVSPVGVFGTAVMALLLWRSKRAIPLIEKLGLTLFTVGMLARLRAFLFVVPADTQSYFATFSLWFGPLYLLIFFIYETRRAIVLSCLVYSLTLGMGLYRLGMGAENSFLLYKSLTHLYTSSAALIAILVLKTWIRDTFVKVQTVATTMTELAHTDFLVGTPNRRELYRLLADAKELSDRQGLPLALILLDVDHFKHVNDVHGHPVGDRILVELTERIRQSLRPPDHFGRWGGEEFMIICPGTDIRDAEKIALTVKEHIEREPFAGVGRITASFGLANAASHLTLDVMIQRADAALYLAKAKGRNRVEVDPELKRAGLAVQ